MSKLFSLACALVLITNLTFADCTSAPIIPDVSINFYNNPLGSYTISLQDVLNAIRDDRQNGNMSYNTMPYYKKKWSGSCPGELSGSRNSCIEFTVYPYPLTSNDHNDPMNFTPVAPTTMVIMENIEQYTGGSPNRGEVRIITNHAETQYIYTTDHEDNFCGTPYAVN